MSSVGGAEKYCCVYLPDGTASLAPTRPGLPIRSMLVGLCEKRGLPLSDVTIYLQGKNKVSVRYTHIVTQPDTACIQIPLPMCVYVCVCVSVCLFVCMCVCGTSRLSLWTRTVPF